MSEGIARSTQIAGREQPAPEIDQATGMRECQWEPSFEVAATRDWPPGHYLICLAADNGGANVVHFLIRDDESPAGLVAQSSATAWQA